MQAYEAIYAAKDQVLRMEREIMAALMSKDFETVQRLQVETERIRQEVLHKYAVIIDYGYSGRGAGGYIPQYDTGPRGRNVVGMLARHK